MASVYDFKVDQGSLHTFQIEYKNSQGVAKSLVGFTVKGQVKRNVNDCTAVGDLVCEVTDAAAGRISITVPASFFNDVDINTSNSKNFDLFCYDIKLQSILDPTNIFRLLQGTIKVFPEVTKI